MLKIKVNVGGAKELDKKFALFQTHMRAGLIPAWTRIAAILQKKIYALSPKKTGRLVRSTIPKVRPMHVKSVASAINPIDGYNYAGIQHGGGMAYYMGNRRKPIFIPGKFYMTIPLAATGRVAPDIIQREIAKIIAQCGL